MDPFLITSIFVPICVTYGRMQLTRAKRDASNPMHLRSHWHGEGMFWELERMDEMKWAITGTPKQAGLQYTPYTIYIECLRLWISINSHKSIPRYLMYGTLTYSYQQTLTTCRELYHTLSGKTVVLGTFFGKDHCFGNDFFLLTSRVWFARVFDISTVLVEDFLPFDSSYCHDFFRDFLCGTDLFRGGEGWSQLHGSVARQITFRVLGA